MFQAFVESESNSSISGQLSYNWFIRNVTTSPITISEERAPVEQNSLTWSPRSGSLSTGLKLIEFEVTFSNVASARRDFGFIKVEEANLVALVSGGSEILSSSKYPILFTGSDSFDPAIGRDKNFGIDFVWSCLDGGQMVNHVFSGNRIIVVPNERVKKQAKTCSQNISFTSKGAAAAINNPSSGHIYYIKLTVRKDQRQTKFLQTVYTTDEPALNVVIR